MSSRPVLVLLALSLAACSKQPHPGQQRLPDGTTLIECDVPLRSCLVEAERLCRDESYTVLGANHVVRHYGAEGGDSQVVLSSSSVRVRCLARGAEPPSLTPDAAARVAPQPAKPPPATSATSAKPSPAKPPPSRPEPALAPPLAPEPPTATGVHCVPGASQACVGPGGCQGGQVCLPDGGALGPCDCGGAR